MIEPTTLHALTWTTIGFMFGRSFGKRLDQTIKKTEWFKQRSELVKRLIGNALDFMHHFWMGMLLMLYSAQFASAIAALGIQTVPDTYYWFGVGLFLDDLPDLPERLKKYFNYLGGSIQ